MTSKTTDIFLDDWLDMEDLIIFPKSPYWIVRKDPGEWLLTPPPDVAEVDISEWAWIGPNYRRVPSILETLKLTKVLQ